MWLACAIPNTDISARTQITPENARLLLKYRGLCQKVTTEETPVDVLMTIDKGVQFGRLTEMLPTDYWVQIPEEVVISQESRTETSLWLEVWDAGVMWSTNRGDQHMWPLVTEMLSWDDLEMISRGEEFPNKLQV